jgi:hypothetical protein
MLSNYIFRGPMRDRTAGTRVPPSRIGKVHDAGGMGVGPCLIDGSALGVAGLMASRCRLYGCRGIADQRI